MGKPTNRFHLHYHHMNQSSTTFNSTAISFVSSSWLFSPSVSRYIFQNTPLEWTLSFPTTVFIWKRNEKANFPQIDPAAGGSDWFSSRHHGGTTGCILRLLYYPSLPPNSDYQPDVDIRAGAHSDYGSITLLFRTLFSSVVIKPNLTINSSRTTFPTRSWDPSSVLFFGAKMDPSSNPASYHGKWPISTNP